jgi:hypothetical protein
MRTGDHVLHKPTGEKWLVRYVRPDEDRMSWCGWPPGEARISDCDLVYSCTDAEHEKLLAELSSHAEDIRDIPAKSMIS